MTISPESASIGILDTSVATNNTGDQIIMNSALNELNDILVHRQSIRFPTHEKLSSVSTGLQKKVLFNIACGTNLLHSHMGLIKQWNIGLYRASKMKPVVLLGVGWRSQKKRKTDFYTRVLLRMLLSDTYLHSVRDSYAESKLRNIGIDNVVNTGCPTIWCLDENHCKNVPAGKGRDAVMVLTDYSKNIELDKTLADMVLTNYRTVYYWCQGTKDYEYITQLGLVGTVKILPSSMLAYQKLLSDDDISLDYIGTRLHGGIFALQHKRRSIIIGVDHRANMKGSDFNLPVIDRYKNEDMIRSMIENEFETRIDLPLEKIRRWKSQFRL